MRVIAARGGLGRPERECDFSTEDVWLAAADGRYRVDDRGRLLRQRMVHGTDLVRDWVPGLTVYTTTSAWGKPTEVWRLPPEHVALRVRTHTWKLARGITYVEETTVTTDGESPAARAHLALANEGCLPAARAHVARHSSTDTT